MTSIGFIVRKLLKSVGVCNKQNHYITASRLVYLLTEKKETLGCNSWEDTREILQLSENYWELKRLFNEQENLEIEDKRIREQNDDLTHKADSLTAKSETSMTSISTEKNKLIQKSIELNNEIKSKEEHCELSKSQFIALSVNLKKTDDNEEASETQNNVERLKDEYTQGRKKIGMLKLRVKENDLKIERTERNLKNFKSDTRNQISEAMNKVTKSAKLVATYSAKIGSIETAKKEIYMKIGSYLSDDKNSNNPQIIEVLNKNKLIMSKIKGLNKSIMFHRSLGT